MVRRARYIRVRGRLRFFMYLEIELSSVWFFKRVEEMKKFSTGISIKIKYNFQDFS